MKRIIKKILKGFLVAFLALVVVIGSYLAYLVFTYYRLPDNIDLTPDKSSQMAKTCIRTGKIYEIVTCNMGFGAYKQDYDFFMDGGSKSWADSKESAENCIKSMSDIVEGYNPNFILFQEIDVDGTRTYHLNEYEILRSKFTTFDSVFAQNYDSPFLFYPFTQPHGKNKSGIVTMSDYPIEGALRRSLPISDSVTKILDLDRCYSISRVPVSNGKFLSLFNVHLSAYGSSDEVRKGQLEMLTKDMQKEYKKGNYVICGGDFNHNLKLSDKDVSAEEWAQPLPRKFIPDEFGFCIDEDGKNISKATDTCRDAGEAYNPDTTTTWTLDGFIISDNVKCKKYENKDEQFKYSDHNPVYMEFELK